MQNSGLEDVLNWIREVTRLRQTEDLPDFTSLRNHFVSGRTVERIPTASADVQQQDVVGDVALAANGSEAYVLVDNMGTLVWAKYTLTTTW